MSKWRARRKSWALQPAGATGGAEFLGRFGAARCRGAGLTIVGGVLPKAQTIGKHRHDVTAVHPPLGKRCTTRSLHWKHGDAAPAGFRVCRVAPTVKGTSAACDTESGQCSTTVDTVIVQQRVVMDTHAFLASCKAVTGRAAGSKVGAWVTPRATFASSVCLAEVGASLCALITPGRYASLAPTMTNAAIRTTSGTLGASFYHAPLATSMRNAELCTSVHTFCAALSRTTFASSMPFAEWSASLGTLCTVRVGASSATTM